MFGGGGGGPRQVQQAPAPPAAEDKEVQDARARRLTAGRYARGFTSTIATDRMSLGGGQQQGTAAGTPGAVFKLGG